MLDNLIAQKVGPGGLSRSLPTWDVPCFYGSVIAVGVRRSMGMLLQIIATLMGSDICGSPIQIPTQTGLPSGHVPCYSHEINLSKAIQVDLHNCNCNCVVGQEPNAALFSPLSYLVDLPGFPSSPLWTMFLLKETQCRQGGW